MQELRIRRAMVSAIVPTLAVMVLQYIISDPQGFDWWLAWVVNGQIAWVLLAAALFVEYRVIQAVVRPLPYGLVLGLRAVLYTVAALLVSLSTGLLLHVLGFPLPPLMTASWGLPGFFGLVLVVGIGTWLATVGSFMERGTLVPLLLGRYRRPQPVEVAAIVIEFRPPSEAESGTTEQGWLDRVAAACDSLRAMVRRNGGRVVRMDDQALCVVWSGRDRESPGPETMRKELADMARGPAFAGIAACWGCHAGTAQVVELGAGKRDLVWTGPAVRGARKLADACRKTASVQSASREWLELIRVEPGIEWRRVGHIAPTAFDPEILVFNSP